MSKTESIKQCPCGAGLYQSCCGLYHMGDIPPTAEKLMRARYSAYVLNLSDFIFKTWHPTTRLPQQELRETSGAQWIGLKIKQQSTHQDTATVEFIARYKMNGKAHRFHEISRFVRENGQWLYVDGHFPDPASEPLAAIE